MKQPWHKISPSLDQTTAFLSINIIKETNRAQQLVPYKGT